MTRHITMNSRAEWESATEYRAAVLAKVLERLPLKTAWLACWGKSHNPSVDNPEVFSKLQVGGLERIRDVQIRRILLTNDAATTLLVQSDGLWPALERVAGPSEEGSTGGRKHSHSIKRTTAKGWQKDWLPPRAVVQAGADVAVFRRRSTCACFRS